MVGGKDPECRGAFPWDQRQWNAELRSWVKLLVSTRKRIPALRRGDYQHLLVDNRRRCFAFARTLGDSAVMVVMNISATRRHVRIQVSELGWEDGRILRNILEREEFIVSGDSVTITLPPWSGKWLM